MLISAVRDLEFAPMPYDLSGYNVITGTSAGEQLSGTKNKDAIYGNGGADTLFGGDGADVLFGGSGGGVRFDFSRDAVWNANATTVDANTGQSFTLNGWGRTYDVYAGQGSGNTLYMPDQKQVLLLDDAASPGVDSIRLHNIQTIQTGNSGAIVNLSSGSATYGDVTITGGGANDVLIGNAGNDKITGGLGEDYLSGGAGNDTLSGGSGKDKLWGGAGNDVLDGGVNYDTMSGGTGNDTYIVSATLDVVNEASGEGIDLVLAAASFTLTDNVENLTLTGSSTLSGTGNGLDNVITGNGASNVIDGGAGNDTIDGGAGADQMTGGAGNDTFIVDNLLDVVTEGLNQGIDTVKASVAYTLGANTEHLVLTGTAAIDGTGNGLDNTITGNAGNNVLDGGLGNDKILGGAGNDTVTGGEGNDNLMGEEGNDVLVGGAGNDHLNGGARNDTLDGGSGNDRLFGGGGNDALSGGDGNDSIWGDGGNDIIFGGAGNDYMASGQLGLTGSLGNDTFAWERADAFKTDGSSAGFDTIADFAAGDRLDFSRIFAGLAPAPIDAQVRVSDSSSGTVVSASIDGGITFNDVVLLSGVHADLDDLTAAGQLVV